jgi:transcriptional regulator with XRE-family HTH domain
MKVDEMTPAYAQEVGQRLRSIRRQQGLSLQAVEDNSEREFKASVMGAYERGERIISVLRLQRLAGLYGVPVDQLLPRVVGTVVAVAEDGSRPRSETVDSSQVTIDLARLEVLDAPERDLIRRYVGKIQIQRGDYNGRVITIRGEDVHALARVFEREEPDMRRRLDELGVRI